MSPMSAVMKNNMLDGSFTSTGNNQIITHMSLHSAYSSTGGNANAAARQSITMNTAAAGSKDSSNTPAFGVSTGSVIGFVGLWSHVTNTSAPVFGGMWPAGSGAPIAVSALSTATPNIIVPDLLTLALSTGGQVVFWDTAGTLPTGIVEGDVHYIIAISTAAETIQVSTSDGGAAKAITADGNGIMQTMTVETFNSSGTYTVSDFDIDLNL